MPKKYPPEVHDRAVRMALDRLSEYPSIWATAKALAPMLDVGPETLRKWIVQAQIDSGRRHGATGLAGTSSATPKSADGVVEMIRQIKVSRDNACKARTSAIITLKSVVINAAPEIRELLGPLGDKALIGRCSSFRPGVITGPASSTKHTLRALARRFEFLDAEIKGHDAIIDSLTKDIAPTLREGFGIGPDTAAELLIIFGDNPDRIHGEAAFAKMCGVAPVPASSGMTNRHRLAWNGHRQANAALYRTAIVRMSSPTDD